MYLNETLYLHLPDIGAPNGLETCVMGTSTEPRDTLWGFLQYQA